MVFMYIVLSTAALLIASVVVAVYQQKQIKVSVVAREEVNEKDFFALRVESEDFLFVRDEVQDVSFIQGLDDVDEFNIKNLAEQFEVKKTENTLVEVPKSENVIPLKSAGSDDKLIMPKSEKKVS